ADLHGVSLGVSAAGAAGCEEPGRVRSGRDELLRVTGARVPQVTGGLDDAGFGVEKLLAYVRHLSEHRGEPIVVTSDRRGEALVGEDGQVGGDGVAFGAGDVELGAGL